MPNIAIQTAEAEHLPEVHRMLIALAHHRGAEPTTTPAVLAQIAFDDPRARLLVARLTDSPARHPVGYALIRQGQGGAVLEQLYVQPPFRGLGVGRALAAAVQPEPALQ